MFHVLVYVEWGDPVPGLRPALRPRVPRMTLITYLFRVLVLDILPDSDPDFDVSAFGER
jgi:hypothetical protein